LVDSASDKHGRQALELVSRLERISVDSHLAHRASGVRVALLRFIDRLDTRDGEISAARAASLEALIEQGYAILEKAAREMRGNG
jgi:hypothetical protein